MGSLWLCLPAANSRPCPCFFKGACSVINVPGDRKTLLTSMMRRADVASAVDVAAAVAAVAVLADSDEIDAGDDGDDGDVGDDAGRDACSCVNPMRTALDEELEDLHVPNSAESDER